MFLFVELISSNNFFCTNEFFFEFFAPNINVHGIFRHTIIVCD